jgi:hypothetical protein
MRMYERTEGNREECHVVVESNFGAGIKRLTYGARYMSVTTTPRSLLCLLGYSTIL